MTKEDIFLAILTGAVVRHQYQGGIPGREIFCDAHRLFREYVDEMDRQYSPELLRELFGR